jgi:hypothetical protein
MENTKNRIRDNFGYFTTNYLIMTTAIELYDALRRMLNAATASKNEELKAEAAALAGKLLD